MTQAGKALKPGVGQQTFYRWKKKFGGMRMAELRRLKDESKRLKSLLADLSLDKQIFQDVLSNSSEIHTTSISVRLLETPKREDGVPVSDSGQVRRGTRPRLPT